MKKIEPIPQVPLSLNETVARYYRDLIWYDPLVLAVIAGWDVDLLNLQGLS